MPCQQPARALGGGDPFPPHHSHFDDGPGGAAGAAARDEDLAMYPENRRRLQDVCTCLCLSLWVDGWVCWGGGCVSLCR